MTRPRSLVELLRALRSEEAALGATLDELAKVFDRREPEVRAFLPEPGRFDRLRREAAALGERFPIVAHRPPLFGLPVAVKDIFHVDGFPTRAGSRVPPELLAGPEAAAVTALKAAGALILGKTVTTEFAYFAPGPTRNPRDPERTPGGSSSGSAAAVAAGMAPLALGTQTIGSISRPASFCGVVGFKPSYDRISRAGVVPLSPALDHVGLFVDVAADVEPVAAVLCDGWRRIDRVGRPRLAIPVGPYLDNVDQAEPATRSHFEAVAVCIERLGFEVATVPAMPDFAEIRRRHETIVAAEAARVHEAWYDAWKTDYHEKTRGLIEGGREVTAEELGRALHGRTELRVVLENTLEDLGFDLWLSPAATGPAPRGLDWTGDPVMNLPWTHAGLPTLTLRAGTIDGMPMGIQLAAGWRRDEELLAWGARIERELGPGVRP